MHYLLISCFFHYRYSMISSCVYIMPRCIKRSTYAQFVMKTHTWPADPCVGIVLCTRTAFENPFHFLAEPHTVNACVGAQHWWKTHVSQNLWEEWKFKSVKCFYPLNSRSPITPQQCNTASIFLHEICFRSRIPSSIFLINSFDTPTQLRQL